MKTHNNLRDSGTLLRRGIVVAMLSALAFVLLLVTRIPFMPVYDFLKYDPKAAVAALCGFILGPLPALLLSLIVALIELVTVSQNGPLGALMTFLSAAPFAGISALIYRKKRTLPSAAFGLLAGALSTVALMIPCNYIITPLYTKAPREMVVNMLLPTIIPFNLIVCGLNAAAVLLCYRPLITGLDKSGTIPNPPSSEKKENWIAAAILGTMLLTALILTILAMNEII